MFSIFFEIHFKPHANMTVLFGNIKKILLPRGDWEHSGSGRVLDLRPRGHRFHKRHCVVSVNKTHLSLLSTGSSQEDLSQHI